MNKPKLGFIGLGLMGSPIALKLCEKGYQLTVWGRNADKLKPLLDIGAEAADSPATLAAESDIVFLCVTDTNAVETVVFGANGIAETADNDKILIDHSTIQAQATRQFAQRLLDKTGMHWLDAPVSGGAAGVAKKTLAVMAGGDNKIFERVEPVVMEYAGRFTLMGPIGAGQSTKLVNQALVAVNMALLAEVTKLAQNAGIDVEKIPAALAGGRADSSLLQEYMPYFARADFSPRGRIDIILKDLELIADAARATRTPMPLTALTEQINRILVNKGLGATDNAAMITLYDNPSDSAS